MHVPVLDDLAFLQPEDINDGNTRAARLPDRVNVQDHKISVREDPLDFVVRFKMLCQKKIFLIAAIRGDAVVNFGRVIRRLVDYSRRLTSKE